MSQRMSKSALVAAVFIGLIGSAARADEVKVVNVMGEATIRVAPDQIVLTFGITEFDENSPQAALEAASAKASAIIETVKAEGFADKDLQTQTLRLDILYENSEGDVSSNSEMSPDLTKISGYSASTSLSLRMKDFDAFGGLVGKVVGAGVNEISDISFGLQDESAVRDQAMQEAVRNGEYKAGLLAGAAGITLGPITAINEGGVSMQSGGAMRMMADSAETMPIAGGEIEVSATVQMQFAIEAGAN